MRDTNEYADRGGDKNQEQPRKELDLLGLKNHAKQPRFGIKIR